MTRRCIVRTGFSLLELMVVVAIVGLVVSVVVACFSGGIRVWESARILTHVEQEAYFGVENIRRDIANTFRFKGIKFQGSENDMSFPAVIEVSDGEGGVQSRIGTVKYFFNASDKTLMRLFWPYPASEESAVSELIASVESASFRYREEAPADAAGWIEAWSQPTSFPSAVSIELKMPDMQNIVVEREIPLMEGLWRDDS